MRPVGPGLELRQMFVALNVPVTQLDVSCALLIHSSPNGSNIRLSFGKAGCGHTHRLVGAEHVVEVEAKLVVGDAHAAVLVDLPPRNQGVHVHVDQLLLHRAHALRVGLIVHVGRQRPSIQEGQAVNGQHTQTLPIQVVKKLVGFACIVQGLQTRSEGHPVHAATAIVVQETKDFAGVIPEALTDQQLEARQFHCCDRVKLK
mmetsp:Transcript_1166/g.2600  ORF Transcript_1166/g.2600 Transcript_1166/m.2600 type:complete len:202 (-) Transcript_1166:797-1402(-)